MKTFQWPLRAFLFISLLQIISCTKTVDTTTSDSISLETSSNAVTPDLSKCKIRKIYQEGNNTIEGVALFSYNNMGNPYSVLYNGGDVPNAYYFKYDASNRLTEWVQWWGSQEWEHHYYRYKGTSTQALIDSAVEMDAIGRPHRINVSTIEYDAQGRVVKETIVNTKNPWGPLNPIRRPTYTYDSRGNLAVAGWKSSSYDYKINPLRQNPIFQFVFRNYSMNNASVQPKYNSLGLPLSITPNNDFIFNHIDVRKVLYDCE